MPNAKDSDGTIRMQPTPILFQIGRLNDVTAITRHWAEGDSARCRLCPQCTAERNVCTVLTEEPVADEQAPLYSSLELDFDAASDPVRIAAPRFAL